MNEQYNKLSTESMQSLVGEIKQIINDARAHAIRSVDFCRVHKTYPKGNALRSQLNWSQYRMLIQIPDPDKREYYELEAVNEGWTGRQLERQRQLFMLQQENKDKED